jgi:bifunctional enzyme CysN/CysC
VTLLLADQVDCSRGDVIAGLDAELAVRDRLDATLVWMANEALVPGRAYRLKIGTRTVAASVSRVREVRDPASMEKLPGRPLALNEIGRCELVLDQPIAAALYRDNRTLGGFILIDRATHATVAAGMIEQLPDQAARPDTSDCGAGRVIWLVGSSSDERLHFARRARDRLRARGRPALILDAAAVRAGLSSDLGHSEADDAENRRRTGEVARLMSRAGVTVLIALDIPEGEARPGTRIDVTDADSDWDWMI